MKHLSFLILISFIINIAHAQQSKSLSKEAQIHSALMAVPADKRDSASVYGYDASGQLVRLREGQNEIICVADDPSHKGFSVSAYHKELQPFMNRGRELRKQGKSQDEIFK